MTFLDAFNGWSALHLLGSFILTTTLGTTSLGPIQVSLISFGLGTTWEIVADQELRINDPRGGDYYDLIWDFAGCAAGALVLSITNYSGRDGDEFTLGLRVKRFIWESGPPGSGITPPPRYPELQPAWDWIDLADSYTAKKLIGK